MVADLESLEFSDGNVCPRPLLELVWVVFNQRRRLYLSRMMTTLKQSGLLVFVCICDVGGRRSLRRHRCICTVAQLLKMVKSVLGHTLLGMVCKLSLPTRLPVES